MTGLHLHILHVMRLSGSRAARPRPYGGIFDVSQLLQLCGTLVACQSDRNLQMQVLCAPERESFNKQKRCVRLQL